MKKVFLIWLCNFLADSCHYFHWLDEFLIERNFKWDHCKPTTWSYILDEKYNLGQWAKVDDDD